MRINQGESITLSLAGADVTLSADLLADLWIRKIMKESAGDEPADPLKRPPLAEGELYLGLIVSADGTKRHHTIVLPHERDKIDYPDAMAWAAGIGGALPDRVEQALMWATMRDQFQAAWYWSCEQRAAGSYSAWCQNFGYGSQSYYGTSNKLRARAVRRVYLLSNSPI
ncbi:MAG: hypothetical protein PHQ05_10230 [Sterolibacterium sp.]|nr:hypothetical protein [Sterolibacterium sp.]